MLRLDVFLPGIACGMSLVLLTSFRTISTREIRWVLIACGLLLVSRYISLASTSPRYILGAEWFRLLEIERTLGLWVPYAISLDQVLRHPAMTPKRVLRGCVVVSLIYLLASYLPVPLISIALETLLALGLVGFGLFLARKIPALREGLVPLVFGTVCLSLVRLGFVFELACLWFLWDTIDTARRLQQQPFSV